MLTLEKNTNCATLIRKKIRQIRIVIDTYREHKDERKYWYLGCNFLFTSSLGYQWRNLHYLDLRQY